jgi:membrane fusion protein (multidrug efflux system)
MVRTIVSLAACVAIIAVGAGIVVVVAWARNDDSETETRAERLSNVRIEVLEPVTVEDIVTLTGRIMAWEDVVVSSETRGKVDWQGVQEGQSVAAGEELFKIDTKSIQARLSQARAQCTLCDQEYERVKNLKERGVSPDQALDNAVANKDVAAANLQMLQIELAKSVIAAPFDGIVDKVFAEQEEFVDVGTPLAHLVQVHKVKAEVGLPERDVPFFSEGDRVSVRLDALPDRTFEGIIHRIATSADMMTRTFLTEIELDNPEGCLRPGMIARADMVRNTYPNSIQIPIFAAILADEQRFVFVEEDGVARLRAVEAGVIQGSSAQITKGLSAGDHLIVSGQYDVRDGEPVNVQQESPVSAEDGQS